MILIETLMGEYIHMNKAWTVSSNWYICLLTQVAWYRLFGRSAAGSNVKARVSDYTLPGTGDEVNRCDFLHFRLLTSSFR